MHDEIQYITCVRLNNLLVFSPTDLGSSHVLVFASFDFGSWPLVGDLQAKSYLKIAAF